jgi:hypothetical protein
MPPRGGHGGGGRRPVVAQAKAVGEMTEQASPTQFGTISQIANPPKPVTAG